MDVAGDVRILALHAAMSDSGEFRLRAIYRWYSKTFATPLHLVDTLPITSILQAYFEDRYEDLNEEELEAERARLTETSAQRKERIKEEEMEAASEAAFMAMAQLEAKKLEDVKLPEQTVVGNMEPKQSGKVPDLGPSINTQQLPPDVKISFVSEGFFDELLDNME